MNFRYMPELAWRYGYGACLTIILLAGLWLFLRFRRSGWL